MKSEILSVKEKIGYGMGDAASHIIFDNVMLYMMFFYTDIFGIPAGFVGTMFLLARALDAISDPCMGLLADRTRSRWGKFRPWVLFGALPFGIVCVLAYSTPDLSLNGKMIYAAITYTLLTLLYTVVNIPYCALGGVITNDPTQRISLQSWRFVLATAGGMLSTVLMMPLVKLIGVLHQLVTPIQWVIMSDTVDYGEWCNGKRLTGISFAGTLFVLKLGLALGGALIGWMLAGGGYDAAAKTQNSATISIIIALFTIVPAICYLLSAAIAKRYYTLKSPFLKTILEQLAQGAHRNEQEFTYKELQN
ncbi:MFS transporter [Salmonella enterica]|nr:MFS transporter [Salmonella enterica]EJX0411682.1 MFS transporter [Salmonella enterica]EMA5681302.1 MFS transporter [Salmonella enterica]EMA5836947.1 MFS transporter [Salmonella enterica]EMA6041065.1 MFS transporter [Salmonella enterica]